MVIITLESTLVASSYGRKIKELYTVTFNTETEVTTIHAPEGTFGTWSYDLDTIINWCDNQCSSDVLWLDFGSEWAVEGMLAVEDEVRAIMHAKLESLIFAEMRSI